MILIKRPIRYWQNNLPAKGLKHTYRLIDAIGNRTCAATYKGKPYIGSHRDTPYWVWLGADGLQGFLRLGWLIVRPPLGLPVGA